MPTTTTYYSFTQDVPINDEIYRGLMAEVGSEPPPGLVVHLAVELPAGGLRYIDVWESQAAHERFVEERLHPAVHRMLAAVFGDDLPPEPPMTPLTVIDVLGR